MNNASSITVFLTALCSLLWATPSGADMMRVEGDSSFSILFRHVTVAGPVIGYSDDPLLNANDPLYALLNAGALVDVQLNAQSTQVVSIRLPTGLISTSGRRVNRFQTITPTIYDIKNLAGTLHTGMPAHSAWTRTYSHTTALPTHAVYGLLVLPSGFGGPMALSGSFDPNDLSFSSFVGSEIERMGVPSENGETWSKGLSWRTGPVSVIGTRLHGTSTSFVRTGASPIVTPAGDVTITLVSPAVVRSSYGAIGELNLHLTPVPEPGAGVLMLVAFSGLGVAARMKKR